MQSLSVLLLFFYLLRYFKSVSVHVHSCVQASEHEQGHLQGSEPLGPLELGDLWGVGSKRALYKSSTSVSRSLSFQPLRYSCDGSCCIPRKSSRARSNEHIRIVSVRKEIRNTQFFDHRRQHGGTSSPLLYTHVNGRSVYESYFKMTNVSMYVYMYVLVCMCVCIYVYICIAQRYNFGFSLIKYIQQWKK